MTDITIGAKEKSWMVSKKIRRAILAMLLLAGIGVLSFVLQPALEKQPPRDCGSFTIGVSAIGGCHAIR